jgi:PAS domain-containing protein
VRTAHGGGDIVNDKFVAKFVRRAVTAQLFPSTTWTFDDPVVSSNDAFLHLIGYSRAEFDAGVIDWDRLTPPEYWPLDDRCIGELLVTQIASPYVKEFVRKDGSRVAVRMFECWELFTPKIGVTVAVELAECERRSRTLFRRLAGRSRRYDRHVRRVRTS